MKIITTGIEYRLEILDDHVLSCDCNRYSSLPLTDRLVSGKAAKPLWLTYFSSIRGSRHCTVDRCSNHLKVFQYSFGRGEAGSSDSMGWFHRWYEGTAKEALGREAEVMKWTVRSHIYQISSQYLDTWSQNQQQNGGKVSSGERTAEIRCYFGCLLYTVNISLLRKSKSILWL